MDYTKLVTKKKQYKYSVNICFDLRNEDRLADFIPNVTTTEIIREYLGGIIRGNADTHSRILYGSYGTGKSHLLTVLSAILGHINTKGKGFRTFSGLIAKYDSELAADIRKYVKEDKPYLVVPVYADYEDFGKCITFSLKKELDKNNISVCFKGFYDEALELVNKWIDGDESRTRLSDECAKLGIEVADLKKGLAVYDIAYEKIFNAIYSGMSYGAVFNSTAGNLVDNLNIANEAIRENYRGIVIVFDEFGRYVEDYGDQLKVKSIQDLAEYCDHSDFDNYLILVSHKQLSMYTRGMKKGVSEEWKKVEGRFKATSINIKYDQCLSLIGHIIPKTKYWESFKQNNEKKLNELYNQAWEFKGFMLPPETDGENPFENGFPLHPITLFALDRLSKKVAQNERTFFTYLAGDEENALFAQLAKYDTKEFHFIGLDAIYDYFEINLKAFKTDVTYDVYKKLQYALNKLGTDKEGYETKILKAIAAINIIADTEDLRADKDTLRCVIDGDATKVSDAIDSLEKKKIIKYMRQYKYYDFFDSSIFDLEGMIEEKLTGVSAEMVVSILNEKFVDFSLYPHRYNEKYHMNRVFIPAFGKKTDLPKKSFYNTLPQYYDGAVIFVLDDQADEMEYQEIEGLPARTVLIVNGKSKTIEEEVKRYVAVQYFYSKRDELAKDDPTVVNELMVYLSEQEAIVRDLIRRWRLLKEKGTFIISNGTVVAAKTEKELSEVLSDIMIETFDRTPIVNNDLLNKNILTGAMKVARRKALQSIMENDNVYEGCSMLSPEYNTVRATLSKNGLIANDTVDDINQIDSTELNRFDDGIISGEPVMAAIKDILHRAESERLPLKVLYEALKAEPFGLRDGYIPLLIAYALKSYQNVFLYFHGTEHSYTEEELTKALSEPENYSLFICNWNEEQITYIEALEKTFAVYLPKGDALNRLEELFRAINTHYSSVSKSARTTEIYVSDVTKRYRDILSLSYKDYNEFFFVTLPGLNDNLPELALQIENIKQELENVNGRQYREVVRTVMRVFDLDENEDMLASLRALYRNDWSSKSHKAFDYTTNGVLDLVARTGELSEEEFIYDLAKVITGFELTYWSDNKIKDFEETLQESVDKLNNYDPDKGLQQGETKITIESAEGEPMVSQFSHEELSVAGQTMLNKMKNTIGSFGGAVSYEEKISIMTEILKEIIG
ncbi:MAG: hypothetical protein LIO99_07220 [Clostridiales bacterium]|nr:hypothetical protein [Clostridiales bacterium]